jgi:hypothetical protein
MAEERRSYFCALDRVFATWTNENNILVSHPMIG